MSVLHTESCCQQLPFCPSFPTFKPSGDSTDRSLGISGKVSFIPVTVNLTSSLVNAVIVECKRFQRSMSTTVYRSIIITYDQHGILTETVYCLSILNIIDFFPWVLVQIQPLKLLCEETQLCCRSLSVHDTMVNKVHLGHHNYHSSQVSFSLTRLLETCYKNIKTNSYC